MSFRRNAGKQKRIGWKTSLHLNAKEIFKEVVGKPSAPSSKCIKAADGHILQETKDITARWEEWIQDLFDDDQEQDGIISEYAETSPSILKSEVKWGFNNMKNG